MNHQQLEAVDDDTLLTHAQYAIDESLIDSDSLIAFLRSLQRSRRPLSQRQKAALARIMFRHQYALSRPIPLPAAANAHYVRIDNRPPRPDDRCR